MDMGGDSSELTDFLFLPHHSRGLRANLELKELNTSTPCLWATTQCTTQCPPTQKLSSWEVFQPNLMKPLGLNSTFLS